jgi:Fe-S oxidoreductase
MEKEPEILAAYARIFEAAGESWTLSSLCLDSACSAWFARNSCGQELWTTRLYHIMEALGARVCIMDDCASPLAPFGAGTNGREEREGQAQIRIASMTEQIFNYLEQGRISLRSIALDGPVTIQDPCNTRKSQELIEFPRTLVEFMEAELTEMVLSRTESVCCGGVLLSCSMKGAAERFGSWKLRHLKESGAKKVLTICASCYRQISRLLALSGHEMEAVFLPQLVSERVVESGEQKA